MILLFLILYTIIVSGFQPLKKNDTKDKEESTKEITIQTPLVANSSYIAGTFRTAPDRLTGKSVSFVVGGDLGGQNYCRRIGTGGIQDYPIFSIMQSLSPDFLYLTEIRFMEIYACSANGPSNVTGWTNIEGNFPSVIDNKVNWSNQTQYKIFTTNTGSIIEQILIYKVFCAIHQCILRQTTMKW